MLGNRFIAAMNIAAALLICPAIARAGGFDEVADQGAQALGRGATFTAKADDATALYWNVAGLARQRGTKVQIGANVHLNSFSFARSGSYPDDPKDPATPWGGKPYPVVQDKNASFLLPMLIATTDLEMFDRLTFGLGVFGPSATNRTFQIGVNGLPSPSRYDFVQSSSDVLFPTFGAGYRLTPQIDIGASVHAVIADMSELQISYVDAGGCKNAEYHPCDVEGGLKASGAGVAASFGILARPSPSFQIGAQVRSGSSVTADGELTTKLAGSKPSPASVTLDLPWIVRAGARYIGMNKTFEEYDVEVDATYETWGSAQAGGPTVTTSDLTGASNKPTTITSTHHWNDTISVRVGGAYNLNAGDGILSIRAGGFYDSPTTDNAYTRLDVNTLAKVAGTMGLGYKVGAFTMNVAYAGVVSISRTVADGEIRPSNGAKEGRSVDSKDQPLPAINNGTYSGFTHTISFGIEVNFETLFGSGTRKVTYGDPEVENLAPAAAPSSSPPSSPPTPNTEESFVAPTSTDNKKIEAAKDEEKQEKAEVEPKPEKRPMRKKPTRPAPRSVKKSASRTRP